MRTSKYVGNSYTSQGKTWTVTKIYLAANYCHGTAHNAYRYLLERITSDGKCVKKVAVSGPTMLKIHLGATDIETLAARKGITQTNYEFVTNR